MSKGEAWRSNHLTTIKVNSIVRSKNVLYIQEMFVIK